MKTVNLLLFISVAYGILIVSYSEIGLEYKTESEFLTPASIGEYKDESAPKISYDRINEVKRKCKSVLSSASELKLEEISRASPRRTKKKLGFRYGDWNQDSGNSPILPFDSTITARNSSTKPLNLVSFWVTDLDLPHRSKKYIGFNGVLLLAITTFNELPSVRSYGIREFELWPSHTQLKISFQGIYVENDDDDERVLCMLGETMLPSRDSDPATDPWKWVKDHEAPPLLQDDQIMLLLRYPKSFTLTKRVIRGELKSLNQKSNLKYFDEINLSSQLGKSAQYEFVSDALVSKACVYVYS